MKAAVWRLVTCAAVASACLATSVANGQRIEAHYSAIANFSYQLDCVSGVSTTCAGRDDYRKLWKDQFGIDPSTSEQLKRWEALRHRHRDGLQSNDARDSEWPIGGVDYVGGVQVAGLSARSVADYTERLSLLLPDALAAEAVDVVQQLFPAFERWWQDRGEALGRVEAARLIAQVASPMSRQHVAEVFALYGSPSGARRTHHVALMLRPGLTDSAHTSGQNLGADSLIEFLPARGTSEAGYGEQRGQLPVIVHEYAHYVLGTVPRERGIQLRKAVLAAGRADGAQLWGLLDEGLATALGNGRVTRSLVTADAFDRFLATPQSLYRRDDINATGRALIGLLDSYVAQHKDIFHADFPRDYVHTLTEKITDTLRTPQAMMMAYAIIVDGQLGSGPDGVLAWADQFQSGSRFGYGTRCCEKTFVEAAGRHREMQRVIAVADDNVRALSDALLLDAQLRVKLHGATRPTGHVATIHTQRVPDQAPTVFVVARDAAALKLAAETFARQRRVDEGTIHVPAPQAAVGSARRD